MFSITRIAAVSLTVLFLAACGTIKVGQDFDMNMFQAKIERGTTTQDQISAWLGAPIATGVSVDKNGEHFEEWTYYYASGRPHDMPKAKVKMLLVTFDKQGVVASYYWSNTK